MFFFFLGGGSIPANRAAVLCWKLDLMKLFFPHDKVTKMNFETVGGLFSLFVGIDCEAYC